MSKNVISPVKKYLAFLVLLATVMVLSACQSRTDVNIEDIEETSIEDSAITVEQDSGEEEWPSDLPRPPEPNPINLQLQTESENTVSVVIWPDDGGVLSVTDDAGNVFTLEITAGSLLAPIEISMTPIASVDGLPEGEGVFGVLLQPDGLIFSQNAELAINVAEYEDLSDAFAFATLEGGDDFHLNNFVLQDGNFTIPIDHFSAKAVAAVGRSAIAATARAGHYNPSFGESRFKNSWNSALATVEPGPDLSEEYRSAFRTWFWTSVNPAVTDAAINPLLNLERGVGEAVRWLKWIDSDDINDYQTEISRIGKLAIGFNNAFIAADLLCEIKDPDQAVKMVRWMAMIDAFPVIDLWSTSVLDRDDVIQKIEDCFSFDFDFRSSIISDFQTSKLTMQVALRQPLNIEFDARSFKIEHVDISLPYERLSLSPPFPGGCQITSEQGFVRIKVWASINFSYSVQEVKEMWVEFDFSTKPAEMLSCVPNREFNLWHANFADVHTLVNRKQEVGAELEIVRSFTEYAKFDFDGQSSLQGQVVTEMSLKHTPD